MDAITELFTGRGTATTMLYLSLVALLGVLLGKIEIRKVKLGIAGVLFSGLFIAHLGAEINHEVLHFVREFGLILFVYSIGIEVGPRFFHAFRNEGLHQNLIAVAIVLLGFVIAYAFHRFGGVPGAVITGILCGSVTNTPSLGAAQEALIGQGAAGESVAVTTMGYALAYPFGVLGVILTMGLIRWFFRIHLEQEIVDYDNSLLNRQHKLQGVVVTVTNPGLLGKRIGEIKKSFDRELAVSRIRRNGRFLLASEDEVLQQGDELYGVSELEQIASLQSKMGEVALSERREIGGEMTLEQILVTNRRLAGKTIEQLGIARRFEANITRIIRAGTEILPALETTVELGDTVRIVGRHDDLDEIRKELGNSVKELAIPNTVPIFVGIFLGVIVGSIPIQFPGLPAPAKLGLAGGPLLVAILIGYQGRIGKFDFYMTPGANMMLREVGIVLFLACVGLLSGGQFVKTLLSGGYLWMLYGAVITLVPPLVIGSLLRCFGYNYLKLCGVLAGAMTDPPALEFANAIAPVQAQATSYATVYPLTMFLRVFLAQILILLTL
ncbi:MAG: putative transporter [Deltaproteobacteria bacterium]|nr:putative transporter [Deltaproteobacteria bacterium]